MKTKLYVLIISALMINVLTAQNQLNPLEIGDILKNPGKYNNEFVTIRGLVTQYTPATAQTTANYLLKSDYGAIIKVNTSQGTPITNEKYEVSGTIVIDQVNMEAYLIEQSKIPLSVQQSTSGSVVNPPATDNTMWYVILAGIVILFLLIIVYFILKSKDKAGILKKPAPDVTKKDTDHEESGGHAAVSADQDFKTIKILQSPPKTLKFIPGKLEIISGLDKGKEFMIAGFPGPNGSVVTIGRDPVTGDAEYAHIQLHGKTVSHKQAELIFMNKKLFVKNISETNYTQLNGVELKPGESAEVIPDSIIKTGEVEFKYIV